MIFGGCSVGVERQHLCAVRSGCLSPAIGCTLFIYVGHSVQRDYCVHLCIVGIYMYLMNVFSTGTVDVESIKNDFFSQL